MKTIPSLCLEKAGIKTVKRFYLLFILLIGSKAFALTDSTGLTLRAVQLNLSTRGAGLEVAGGFKQPLVLRAGVNFITFQRGFAIKAEDGTFIQTDPDVASVSTHLLLDHYPFRSRLFHLTAGLEYAWIQRYTGTFYAHEAVKLGGVEMEAEDFGNAVLGIRWNRLKPYLGVGLKRDIMKRQMAVGLDVGTWYMGSPQLDLRYEGFLETTTIDEQVKQVEVNMRSYAFYPYLALQLRYSLN